MTGSSATMDRSSPIFWCGYAVRLYDCYLEFRVRSLGHHQPWITRTLWRLSEDDARCTNMDALESMRFIRRDLIKIMTRSFCCRETWCRDQQSARPDFHTVSASTDLVEWRELRHIRRTFYTGVQTLYRLISKYFRYGIGQDTTCRTLTWCVTDQCQLDQFTVFTCSTAHWHWNHLLSLWQYLGTFDMDRREDAILIWLGTRLTFSS